VFVIALASPGYEAAFGEESSMPYLSGKLRPRGQLLENYELLDDEALPNYIGMVSGQRPNELTKTDCPVFKEFPTGTAPDKKGYVAGDGCVYPVQALSVADQVAATGATWHAYVDGMTDPDTGKPANCVHPVAGERDVSQANATDGYQTVRNPFVYFHSLLDVGSCAAGDVPIEQLTKDLHSASKTPKFSFISPTACHAGAVETCADGEDGVQASDDFLAEVVPKILGSAAYKEDGLLIVTFAERGPTFEGDSKQVGGVVVSPLSPPGGTIGTDLGPYDVLRTVEDVAGVSPLAGASSADGFAGDLVGSGD
jgi:hypothetical protein